MAETTSNTETRGFQTEARQLLNLMIHSLYSNREIFLRELISNAADAADKLRFEALEKPELITGEPGIWIAADTDAQTLTISDNGIGMSRDEVIDNLGTIARSGTAEFLKNMSGDQQQDASLIGQFGVGFYSAFTVADEVRVISRRAGTPADAATAWTSRGEDSFDIAPAEKAEPGTEITLHLRDDAKEFAEWYRLNNIIKKYSDHIAIPVYQPKQPAPAADDDTEQETATTDEVEWEVINQAKALWTRSRSDVSDEEYQAFYKHIGHDFEDPLVWSHNRVEGRLEYTSLLYIPRRAPFDLWQRDASRGLKLYVQRVFIMDDAEQFLPMYLRFVKGVIDCADLPLNVSREILQQDERIDTIKAALTKRVLDTLAKLAKDNADEYQTFWDELGQSLKEAPAEDFANRDAVAKLMRFATTATGDAKQTVSLDQYIERMPSGQDKIYYVCADSHGVAASSPHLEIFKARGIEVLLLSDRVDDWLMASLGQYDDKPFVDITRGALELDGIGTDPESDEAKSDDDQSDDDALAGLAERCKTALGDRVEEVRLSSRLVSSPACLVLGEDDMGAQMRKLLEASGQTLPETTPSLELNPKHPLIARLDAESDEDQFGELANLLLDQARLAEGSQLEDPAGFVTRLNRLLLSLSSG